MNERQKEIRGLIRKICILLNLLQKNDSRDIIIDILLVILKEEYGITIPEIQEKVIKLRKKNKMNNHGTTNSNIRRQLSRLKKIGLIQHNFRRFLKPEMRLTQLFDQQIKNQVFIPIIKQTKQTLSQLDQII